MTVFGLGLAFERVPAPAWSFCVRVSRGGVRFCSRLKVFSPLGAFFCNSQLVPLYTSKRRRFDGVDPSQRRACPFASLFHNLNMVFIVSVFPPHSNQAKGWRRLSRWTRVLRARFNRRHSAAGFEMGGSEGESSPRLYQPRGPDRSARTCRKVTSAPWPERVSSLISTDGRQPFAPAASRDASLFRRYPSVPLFRGATAVRRRSSARRHPAMIRI
jgi:hypothetical protein